MDTKGKPTLGSKGPISNSSSSIKSNILRHFEGEIITMLWLKLE